MNAGAKPYIRVRASGDGLDLSTAGNSFRVYPENHSLFFSRERDLTFQFCRDRTSGAAILQ